MEEREHVAWVRSRLQQGVLPTDSGTPAQQMLGGLEVLMELLLAGVDQEEATMGRFVALASSHKDWSPDGDVQDVLRLVEQGMTGEGVPAESFWMYRMSGMLTQPSAASRDRLHSESLGAHQAEAHGAQAIEWLVYLIRSTAPSGAWHRVGVGLTETSRINEEALESALASPTTDHDAALRPVVQRQLPIANMIRIYNQLSQMTL